MRWRSDRSGLAEHALADNGAAELQKRQVQLGAALVAGTQTAEIVQPGETALNDPALVAQARSVTVLAACDDRLDTAAAELATVLVMVIAAVGQKPLAALAGPADLPTHRLYAVDQRQELGDVVAVATGHTDGQRDAVGVGQKMMLGATTRAVDR